MSERHSPVRGRIGAKPTAAQSARRTNFFDIPQIPPRTGRWRRLHRLKIESTLDCAAEVERRALRGTWTPCAECQEVATRPSGGLILGACTGPVCPYKSRRFRGWSYVQTAAIRHSRPGPHKIYTVLLRFVPAGDLDRIEPRSVKDQLRILLSRCGFNGSIIVGGLEAGYDFQRAGWHLHFHLGVFGATIEARRELSNRLKRRGQRALKVQSLRDPARQLSYLIKFLTLHRPGAQFGKHRKRAVPMPQPALRELLAWWQRHEFQDFLFLYGCRRRGSRIEAL